MKAETATTKQFVFQLESEQSPATTTDITRPHLTIVGSPEPLKSEQSKNGNAGRKKNEEVREREYLTKDEVARLREAARKEGRYGSRDALIITMLYRHGLRVGELVDLRWSQVSFDDAVLHVKRKKHGTSSTQPIEGDELRALRQMQRTSKQASPFVFTSERGGPLTTRAIQKMIARAGDVASIGFPIHPHMLRHSRGYALANRGTDTRTIQALLGHRNIQNTVIYTALASNRFEGLTAD